MVVNIVETAIDAERYEQRYSIRVMGATVIPFVRRPVTIEPKDGTVCFVDSGPRLGTIPQYSAGSYSGGKWKGVKFEPTHWTQMDIPNDET